MGPGARRNAVRPEDLRQAALALALERGLAGDSLDPEAPASFEGLVRSGALDREDAELLLTEAGILLSGRFPEFNELDTAVAGTAAGLLPGVGGLYPWRDLSRYRPEVYLGEGGMGRVFRVHDSRLNRKVALKFFRAHASLGSGAFLREVQAQARIDHPNVARIFEAGEQEGIPYLSVQVVRGPTLAQAAGRLSLREKVDILRQAALGVQAAHALGIVHRDLKPGNIMLEDDPQGGLRALVVDFGLARDLAEAPGRTTTVMGTPTYMSPEQIEGPQVLVGPHSDIYALGVTLFEVLAGVPPFSGATQAELLVAILGSDPPPLRALDPSLPKDLEAVVQHCLERDVLQRYDSARELAADLERFLAGVPVSVKPVGSLARLARRVRRNPVPLASAAAILALGLGWGGYAAASRARERALGLRMEAQVADLARIRGDYQRLRAEQDVERARSMEFQRRMAEAATASERSDAGLRLAASQARERELAQQVEAAERKVRADAAPRPVEAAPAAAPKEPPEPARPAAASPVPDPTYIPPQLVRLAPARFPRRFQGTAQNPWRNQELSVRVQVQVDAQGRLEKAAVAEGVAGPWGYNEAALQAVTDSAFAPAQRGGKAVAGSLEVRVRFVPPAR